MIAGFIEWVQGNRPCTPLEALAVVVTFAAVFSFNMLIVCWLMKRGGAR